MEQQHVRKEELETSTTHVDPIKKSIGELGKWQIFVCAVVFLLKFPVAWHQMGIIFLAPKPEFHCVDESIDRCSQNCTEHIFDRTIFSNTINMQWDLVCDREGLRGFSQTIFMLGILIGNMVIGGLADKYGRRMPLCFAVTIQLVSGVFSSYTTNFWVFSISRFITAFATGGTMVTSFVLVMEIIGVKWRELISVLYQVPFNIAHLTLPLFAYFIRDWQQLQFALSIPSVILLSYFWLIPESPRWLFTTGKFDESVEILEKAAKMNGMPTENIRIDLQKIQDKKSETCAKGNFFDLFRTKNIRMKSICMNFNWFVCGICFFGVSQYVGETGGNVFKNVALSALFTLPGTVLCIFLLKYWGRKPTLILSNCVCGISMIMIAFIDHSNTEVIVLLATTALAALSISFPTVYLYGGELFPTVIRNIAIGTASMMARVGSMLAPFVATGLNKFGYSLPPLIFGIIPIIGAFLVIFLPETRGQQLPETIEDSENFGKKEKENA